MEPFSIVDIDVVVEDGIAVRKFWHFQLRVFTQINFQLLTIRILQERTHGPHHAEDEDLMKKIQVFQLSFNYNKMFTLI